jgi:hypothetical protein
MDLVVIGTRGRSGVKKFFLGSVAAEPDHLYGFTSAGQKIEWMRTDPRVSVEVDEIANHFQWESVILTGHFHELPDLHAEERTHARKLLQQRSLWWDSAFAARRLKSDGDAILPIFYRLGIESMTGYRAVANAEEYAMTDTSRPSQSTVNWSRSGGAARNSCQYRSMDQQLTETAELGVESSGAPPRTATAAQVFLSRICIWTNG